MEIKKCVLILTFIMICSIAVGCTSTQNGAGFSSSETDNASAIISHNDDNNEGTDSSEDDEFQGEIVYIEDEIISEGDPSDGEVYLSGKVERALVMLNTDERLAVAFSISSHAKGTQFTEIFTHNGMTRSELKKATEPILLQYNDEFELYKRERDAQIDWNEVKTSEEKQSISEQIEEEWNEIWDESHDINPKTLFREFEQALHEAGEANYISLMNRELERLTALGFNVFIVQDAQHHGGGYLAGYLTAEQLSSFDPGDNGYIIMGISRDEPMYE